MNDKKQELDYSLVCRTCLQSNVEMLFLSAIIKDNFKEERYNISYLECLQMFIQFEETVDETMPQRICLECASALQVSYWFLKNAMQAQDMLKRKLAEIKRKKQLHEMEMSSANVIKPKRYRCKICNVRVETKRSLKDHVKLHLDIIVYNCQLCSFESHNRNSLSGHYIQIHGFEAAREQLKPTTKLSSLNAVSTKFAAYDREDGAIKSDHFHLLPEESSQISYQKLSKNSLYDQQVSNYNASPNYNPINAPFTPIAKELDSDLSTANEFMVMADGRLEKVVNKGVVIEYIDAQNNCSNHTLDSGLVLDNIMHVQNADNSLVLEHENDIGQMDVDDLIIEDLSETIEETQVQENIMLPLEAEIVPATVIEQPKKIMCKICTKDFMAQEQLKNHMLTHNEIPHFFCDQCKFYTFFKIDLHQHYKSKHNLQPTNKQLQPKNKQKTFNEYYACDLCFYEAETKFDIKKHYKVKHNLEANEIHLKPTKGERIKSKLSPLTAKAKAAIIASKPIAEEAVKNAKVRSAEDSTPDYPNGLNCRKCRKVFYWRKKLYEHYKMHSAEEAALKQAKQIVKVQKKLPANLSPTKTKNIRTPLSKTTQSQMDTTNTSTFMSLGTLPLSVSTAQVNALNSAAPLTPSSSSTYTLPSDAVPQIVETDQTIENVMDFDFNCDDDALFEDFEDDVDVENNSDENDSEFRNALLTSDDDFEDVLYCQNNVTNASSSLVTNKAFCAHCQKSFLSQYQYENHMFVHRGLAPYRCEMCTNLYNTKRCLIRHYKAVHKSVPTRDMIQAKGDKVCDDKISIQSFVLEPTTCFMCGKCPYESSDFNNLNNHIKSSHNIEDELPFECPRCIRSFADKIILLRHLEQNHSLTPINKRQNVCDGGKETSAVDTSTSLPSITTTINNHVNMMKTETIETNASCGYNDLCIKKEQQHEHEYQNNRSDAVAQHIITIPFEESASPTRHLANNETSDSSINPVAVMPYTANDFAAFSVTAAALDDNDKGQPLFKCKICFLTCYDLANFNEHGKRIECRKLSGCSPGDKVLFECEICHCNYKTMYLLKHHLKRHIGRKFLCADCPKTFINKVELRAHKHVHSGERPHKCDVCTKSFRYVHHLKRHKDSVHYGKRHPCTEPNCSRKFTTLTQLKLHLWTHNGIVPYKCPLCSRLFKKRLLLREHCAKIHYVNLSEEEIAKIFRNSLGYTNPHDFTVTIGNGKMLRRGDLETMGASGVIKCAFK